MRDLVLVLNAGSSSLKAELYSVRPAFAARAHVAVERIGRERPTLRVDDGGSEPVPAATDYGAAAEQLLDRLATLGFDQRRLLATAHRVVHGGERFAAPTVMDDAVVAELDALTPLAPLHNPAALAVLRAARSRFPGVPAVAVFDTALFRDLPAAARCYAIPADWRRGRAIRRYGFHGIAHEYLHTRYRALTTQRRRPERVIGLHLGQGCSATALLDGRPVETSMGYTPLEGLIMGSRCGDIDAGVVLELARAGVPAAELDDALNRRAGLLGLSEASDDMRELLDLEAAGEPRAGLAIEAFCHRLHKYLGAYAAVLGGVDVLLFGGGIGEHAPEIRRRVCAGLEWLGLELDPAANAAAVGRDATISSAASRIEVFAIRVREELSIARAACACLGIATADDEAPSGAASRAAS
ncbi:MAG TPA: acetate/propionate family kinase [Gammaproteobacteria bacterium]|nr:acetate/propionate family kinase [Gammaproteobacteria bacterium]